jgi:hypothetical protein
MQIFQSTGQIQYIKLPSSMGAGPISSLRDSAAVAVSFSDRPFLMHPLSHPAALERTHLASSADTFWSSLHKLGQSPEVMALQIRSESVLTASVPATASSGELPAAYFSNACNSSAGPLTSAK